MNNNSIFKIDIDSVLKSKMPKHYKKIPRFIINRIKKLIHEDELNNLIEKNENNYGVDFMNGIMEDFNLSLTVHNESNIPENGKFIFVSNHPLGGLDGICLSSYIGNKYDGKIKYLVNDLLINIKNLEPIFLPINKYGSQPKKFVEIISEAYNSDNQIITFPAGLCSRKIKKKIVDLEWMKDFVVKAQKYKRDIIPIYFQAQNSNFFYNIANIRKMLGIKFNIELIFLSNEMFKNRNKNFKIFFGKPISWETLDKSKKPIEWARFIKNIVYQLHK